MMTTTAEPAARLGPQPDTRTSAGAAGPLPRLGPRSRAAAALGDGLVASHEPPPALPGEPSGQVPRGYRGLETVFLRKAARLTATLLTAAKAWTPRDVPQEGPTLVPPDKGRESARKRTARSGPEQPGGARAARSRAKEAGRTDHVPCDLIL